MEKMKKMGKMSKRKESYFRMIVRNITTISGTVYLTEKQGKRFIVWSVLMAANMFLTLGFIFFVNQKYNGEQIVTEINPNCKVSQVPFPCVTICNFNPISEKESQNVQKLLTHYNISKKEMTDFLSYLPRLKFFELNSSLVPNFKRITDILKNHYYDMDILMEEVHQKCESLLLYCSFNRKQQKCEDVFNIMKTLEGYCCGFNYVGLEDDSTQNILSEDENIEFYDPNGDSSQTSKMLATSESGRTSGLHVIFNVEPDDYPSWVSAPFYGGKVLLSDPNDYPETTVIYQFFSPGEALDLKVVPFIFQADPNLEAVDPSIRNCWYPNEVKLDHTNRYSFETCNTECNMRTYFNYCGCIPYKYPKKKGMRICEIADLVCLHNLTVHISNKERVCNAVCNIECNDKRYSMASNSAPFLPSADTKLPPGTNLSHVTSLRVYYQTSSCNCFHMKLLIDLNFIIATFGGVFSLGFGGSILTLIELGILLLSTAYIACCDQLSVRLTKMKQKLFPSKVKHFNTK